MKPMNIGPVRDHGKVFTYTDACYKEVSSKTQSWSAWYLLLSIILYCCLLYYCLLLYIIIYYFSPLCYFYRLLLLFAVFHCHCYQQTLGSYRKDFRVPVDTVTRATLVASELIPLSKSWESDILLRFTAASMLSPRSVSLQSIQLRSSLSAEYRLHEDAKALDWIINKLWEIYSTVDVKMKKWLNYLNFVCSKKRIFMRMYHCLVFFRDVWAIER